MPTTSEYVLYSLLVIIAVLLAVAILVMLGRSRHAPTDSHIAPPFSPPLHPDLEYSTPVVEEKRPQIDSVDLYLRHLDANSRSVESLGSNEYLVIKDAWSLPATSELAQMSKFSSQHDDDYKPSMRLYFNYHSDGTWTLSDQGENASILRKVTDRFQQELDDFRPKIKGLHITISTDGTLSARGSSYQGFEDALNDLCSTVDQMDNHWTPLIWESEGPLPFAFGLEGTEFKYSGSGKGNQNYDQMHEETGSFTLAPGVMAFSFEHTGKPQRHNETGKLTLVRDDPGIFDDPMEVCSFTESGTIVGMLRVVEGMWQDPHPGIAYHLEVRAFGNWHCIVFQPQLGQSKGDFPHRIGLQSGAAVAGPFRTGPRPVRANIQHNGAGQFALEFISLDGTHEFAPDYSERIGQFHLEDQELELMPGKEYLMCGWGDGAWDVELVEGY